MTMHPSDFARLAREAQTPRQRRLREEWVNRQLSLFQRYLSSAITAEYGSAAQDRLSHGSDDRTERPAGDREPPVTG